MTRFQCQPAIVASDSSPNVSPDITADSGFTQHIALRDGSTLIGEARWHAPGGDQGVVQILDLSVAASSRRKGIGGQLLRELLSQATALHRAQRRRFRRVWVNVEQKSQVNARAFLTQHGFHHVGTTTNLLVKQDALIYMKALD